MRHPRLSLWASATAAALLLTGCGHDAADQTTAHAVADLPAQVVQVAPVAKTSALHHHPLPGTVRAVARAKVAAKMMGTIDSVDLAIGRKVEADEVLVTIHAAELEAQVVQAHAALDLAQRDYQREHELLEKGAATAAMVRTLQNRARIATAALNAAEAQLAYTTVRAPFAGVITQRFIEPGDFAALGTPLFAMEGHALEIEVLVPEFLSADPGELFLQLEDARHPLRIQEISPAVDPLTRTRLARLRLVDQEPLQSGQFVRVLWPTPATTALTVPSSAVTRLGQMERVFIVDYDKATMRIVKTGQSVGDRTVILAGLNPGEHVIIAPSLNLRDGQPIRLSP